MAWRRPGDKPLYETMMVSLLTHICVARPQWVNFQPHIHTLYALTISFYKPQCHHLAMGRSAIPSWQYLSSWYSCILYMLMSVPVDLLSHNWLRPDDEYVSKLAHRWFHYGVSPFQRQATIVYLILKSKLQEKPNYFLSRKYIQKCILLTY